MKSKHIYQPLIALVSTACLTVSAAWAQTTYTWANSNITATPPTLLDWFSGGANSQGTWTGGDPVSSNLNTIQFFANTTTALTNTAAATQTVNLNNGGSAFQLGTLTLNGLGSATANANMTMTLSGDALNFSGATGTINLNALTNNRTFTYNVNNAIQLGTAGSGSVLTLTGGGTGTFNFGGSISELQVGGGSLTKSGASTVSLDAANTYTGTTTVNRGVLLLNHANALPGGVGATGGTSNLTFNETGNTANFQAVVGLTSDFSRSIGTSASQVQWTNGGGFAAFGADRTVNFGGNATPSTIVWGNSAANGGFGGYELILGAATATHTVELVNPLDLGSTGRTITVGNGAAAIDAKISSNITGSGPLTVNGNTVGTLQLAGSNSSNGLTISSARVIVNSANALGTGTVTLASGGLASPTSLTVANAVTMTGTNINLGNSAATGDIVLAGPLAVNLSAGSLNAPSFVSLVGLSNVDITGQISGTGATNYVSFVVPADKTLRFGADNSAWTQTVGLRSSGNVVIGHAKALGGGTQLVFGDNGNTSAIVLTSEVDLTGANALSQLVYLHRAGSSTNLNLLTFSGTNSIELAGGVQWHSQYRGFTNDISGGSLIVSGNMILGLSTDNYISSSGTTRITGNIVDPGTGAAGLLLNSPTALSGASSTSKTGLFILSGTNTYTGATTVSAGTLVFSGTQAKAPGTVTAAAAATIGLGVGGANSYTSANVAALFANTLSGFSMNAASGVAVDTTGGDFTVSDALAGSRAFTKLGTNTLTLSAANTYTGATTISEGTLQLNGSTHASSTVAIGTAGILTGSGTVNGNATLTGNGIINTSSATIAGTLGVTGGSWNGNGTVSGLVTASSGTFTIGNSATLTASSGVNVTGGTVVVNGTLSGGLTAAAGTTVYGSGTVTGTTTIAGNHNPGNSPGIQTFGDLSYTGGAAEVQWELNANSILNSPTVVFDQIIVDGDLDFAGFTSLVLLFNGVGSSVDWTDSLWTSNQSWMIYDVSGTTTNFNNLQLTTSDWLDSDGNLFNTTLNGSSFSLAQSGNDVILNYTVIPEPESALLAGLGILLLLRRRRS